jgi:uncharacterized membrane protein
VGGKVAPQPRRRRRAQPLKAGGPLKLPAPLKRLFDWLEPPGSRLSFEPPPRVNRIDRRILVALVPVAVFTALVIAGPLLLPPGSTGDLTGSVGIVDNEPVWSHFPEPARFIYHAGDVACHTKASRSIAYNGNQMPFCTRDVAIFVGATFGLMLCLDARSRLYRAIVVLPWWTYLALLVPIAIDGGMQDFVGFESDNVRRILTGFPAGLAVAFALAFIAYETHFIGKKRLKSDPPSGGQVDADDSPSEGTGSLGSNAVESTPTDKKKALVP